MLPFPVKIYPFEIFTRATPGSSLVSYKIFRFYSDADNLAAAVATYKAINNGSSGGQVDTNHLLDALPGMLQQQHQMHPHHQQQQPPQVAAAMAGTGMFTTPKVLTVFMLGNLIFPPTLNVISDGTQGLDLVRAMSYYA